MVLKIFSMSTTLQLSLNTVNLFPDNTVVAMLRSADKVEPFVKNIELVQWRGRMVGYALNN